MPITVLGTFSLGLIFFVKTLRDYQLRKKMVEKGYVNPENESVLKRFKNENQNANLKWGLLVLFAGIGLVLIEFLPFRNESTLPFGVFAICVSLGFLIYFIISKKLTDKE